MTRHFPPHKFGFQSWWPWEPQGREIDGSARSDWLFGGVGDDTVSSYGGNDRIFASFGDDSIDAGAGDDFIDAGWGNDTVDPGAGNDRVNGGRGHDVVLYGASFANAEIQTFGRHFTKTIVTLRDETGGFIERDRLFNVEELRFSDFTLYLDGRNNAAYTQDDAVVTDEDTALVFAASDLLANDSDFEGDALSVTAVDAVSASGATVSLVNGDVTYDPGLLFQSLPEGATTTDSFSYTVEDAAGNQSTATVTVTITGRNDAPLLSGPDSVTVAENTTGVLATFSATDVDAGDAVTFSLGGADAALFSLSAAGELSFIAAPDFEAPLDAGADNTYDVSVIATDSEGATDTQAVTVTVEDLPEFDIVVSEIMYNPGSSEPAWEWVEIYNAGADAVDLSGWVFDDINGVAQSGANIAAGVIDAGGSAVLYNADALTAADFEAAWGAGINLIGVTGWSAASLNNGGDTLGLWSSFADYDGDNTTHANAVISVAYDDSGDWPSDNNAASIYLTDLGADASDGSNWALSTDGGMTPLNDGETALAEGGNSGNDVGSPGGVRVLQPGDVLISEIQPNPTGSDPSQVMVELSGEAGTRFDGVLVSIESDPGSANPGDINNVATISGTFDANGLLSVLIDDLENPSFTLALLDTFTGDTSTDIDTDDDGTADDLSTFGTVLDAIGVPDAAGDEGLLYGAQLGGADFAYTGDEPRLIFRDGSVGDWYAVNDPDGGEVIDIDGNVVDPAEFDTDPTAGTDTFGAINPIRQGATAPTLISEFQPNPTGSDPSTVQLELSGEPGTNFTGVLVSIDSDAGASGQVDRIVNVSGTFDANGLLTVSIPDLENPSFTVALMDSFSGSVGMDVDANDDGIIDDLSVFGTVYDAIGVPDLVGDEGLLYGAQLGGADFAYTGDEPQLVFRAGSTGDWYAVNDPAGGEVFDIDGTSVTAAAFSTDPTAGDTFGALNPVLGNTPPPPGPETIGAIQGTGAASTRVGQTVTVTAIVVGDFQDGDADTSRDLRGFFLQDANADGNTATSDGIFVYEGTGDFLTDVNLGDRVTVTGTVSEYFGETQLVASSVTVEEAGAVADVNTLATTLTLDTINDVVVDQNGRYVPDLEAYEGMLVQFADTLTVNEAFQLDRFNEVRLTAGDRPEQFTQSNDPDAALLDAYLQEIGSDQIIFDDGLNQQNAPIFDEADLDGNGVFETADGFGMGDTITDLTGVLSYQWAGASASGATWRVRSVEDDVNTFVDAQTRDAMPPDLTSDGGLAPDITIASFNVLNFFTTLDEGGNTTGPAGGDPRGADNLAEYERQLDKLLTSLTQMDADIFGLVELENEYGDVNGDGVFAIGTIVDELNAVYGAGTWDYVDPGRSYVDVSDVISVGIIYNTTSVTYVEGSAEILDDSVLSSLPGDYGTGPVFDGPNTNRAPLAANFTYDYPGGSEEFTVAVTHMKSKGGTGTGGDADLNDGAGNYDETRTEGVDALTDWLDTGRTGAFAEDKQIVLGDFNAYAMEDPIDAMLADGYVNLEEAFQPGSTSYVFDGQTGTLDYAFANDAMMANVTNAGIWNINSDEPDAYDYNLDFGRDPAIFDGDVAYRSSDHDPILMGLNFEDVPMV